MNPLKAISLAAALALVPVLADGPARAEQSPIFGTAQVTPLSGAAAAQVTAKGYYADYYGTLAYENAYNAYLYSYYGLYYSSPNSATEQSYYSTASSYAYNAYIYAYYASYYSASGY